MRRQNNNFSYHIAQSVNTLYVREEGAPDAAAIAAAAATAEAAKIQAAVDAAVATATAGLKAKNDELLGKVVKQNDRLKLFGDMDPEKIKEQLKLLDHDEDLKLFSEGKKHEVIEKHTQRMRQAHLDELKAKDEAIAAESRRADAYKGAVLDAQILSVTGGLHKGAVEDALLQARQLFSLDANGKAVQIGPDGAAVLGKDGKSPFGPLEWIEQAKEIKPHWFPAGTSGGGSQPARQASGSGKTITRADFAQLTPSKQAEVATSGTQIVD